MVFLLSNASSNRIFLEPTNTTSICLHTHQNRSIEINQPHGKEGSNGGISKLPQVATSQKRNRSDIGKIPSRSSAETHPAVALLHRAKAGTGGWCCEALKKSGKHLIFLVILVILIISAKRKRLPTQNWRPHTKVASFAHFIRFSAYKARENPVFCI